MSAFVPRFDYLRHKGRSSWIKIQFADLLYLLRGQRNTAQFYCISVKESWPVVEEGTSSKRDQVLPIARFAIYVEVYCGPKKVGQPNHLRPQGNFRCRHSFGECLNPSDFFQYFREFSISLELKLQDEPLLPQASKQGAGHTRVLGQSILPTIASLNAGTNENCRGGDDGKYTSDQSLVVIDPRKHNNVSQQVSEAGLDALGRDSRAIRLFEPKNEIKPSPDNKGPNRKRNPRPDSVSHFGAPHG